MNLSNQNLGPFDAELLVADVRLERDNGMKGVQHFDISDNPAIVGEVDSNRRVIMADANLDALKAICIAFSHTTAISLNLSNVGIGPEGSRIIVKMLTSKTLSVSLQTVDLSCNSLAGQLHPIVYTTKTPDAYVKTHFSDLLDALEKTKIKWLVLRSIGMGSESAVAIGNKLTAAKVAAHKTAIIELIVEAELEANPNFVDKEKHGTKDLDDADPECAFRRKEQKLRAELFGLKSDLLLSRAVKAKVDDDAISTLAEQKL
eukprot:SAG31_NODE_6405_length_2031_cov_1.337992_2_plen_260_part_00